MNQNLTTKELKLDLQKFQKVLNKIPVAGIDRTPDNKASTLVISQVEMSLDELFFGQWSTKNFTWNQVMNEVVGSIDLVVLHPVSGLEITRVGAASITIMVDKVPDEIKDDSQKRNQWALDPNNKKPSALDLAFPKLKAECVKNAALSLGKLFGRDLNRKKFADYKPLLKGIDIEVSRALLMISDSNSASELVTLRDQLSKEVLDQVSPQLHEKLETFTNDERND